MPDSIPLARCHDCGQRFPEPDAVRVRAKVGESSGSISGFFLSSATRSDHYAVVDVCPPCAKRRQEKRMLDSMLLFTTLLALFVGGMVWYGAGLGWGLAFFLVLGVLGALWAQMYARRANQK